MQERIITLATPVFFLLIALELLAARQMGRQVYHAGDAVASIGLGILSQVTGVFSRLLRIGLYALAYRHVALFHLPASSPLVWIGALLLYDLCYYWLHRAGHEVNLLWAAHVVHHQSEFYNLGTALRQTSSGVLLGWLFYLPMAVIGVPVEVFAAAALIDLLYQFWIHTELIGSLGWFDRWFASPSNHRVHHAVNQRYLDRNYGGILIIWDRLFNSFEPEDVREPCVYGTRAPLRSFNPMWANWQVYGAALRDTWRATTWRERALLWFGPPGWQSAEMARRYPRNAFDIERERHLPPLSPRDVVYGLVQFALLLGVAVDFLGAEPSLGLLASLGYCAYLAASLVSLSAWFDARAYARLLETVRVVGTAIALVCLDQWFGRTGLAPTVILAVAALSLASVGAIWSGRRSSEEIVMATMIEAHDGTK